MLRLISIGLIAMCWAAMSGVPAIAQNPSNPGFYVGLSGSAIFLEDNDATISGVGITVDYETTFGVSGQAGYRFGNGLRVEGEVGYTNIDDADLSALGFTVDLNADLDVWLFTGNAFYDIHVNDWVSPYIGRRCRRRASGNRLGNRDIRWHHGDQQRRLIDGPDRVWRNRLESACDRQLGCGARLPVCLDRQWLLRL